MKQEIAFISAIAIATICGMAGCSKQYKMGTYGYDKAYFSRHGIEVVELAKGMSKVMVVPAWQGRVQTSTTDGDGGISYGWTNYKFIDKGEISQQFNPYGGEERFWIGPEGGPFSYYFARGAEQIYANWKVPSFIDTEPYNIVEKTDSNVVFAKDFDAINATGHSFKIGVKREVALVGERELTDILGVTLPKGLKAIAYKSVNTLTNNGDSSWTKKTGMPSVWLLGSFNPTPTTTVFIPCHKEFPGRKINDEYFGKVPSDRLVYDDGMFYFKIDGEYRSKIGLPEGSAKDLCGSYDSASHVLNILKYTIPSEKSDYVNGQWGPQDNPFGGDVINSYNDGPTDTGTVMGPFYEIETSSPGASLSPGESLTHTQYTVHIQGDEKTLSEVSLAVFGIGLDKVQKVFEK